MNKVKNTGLVLCGLALGLSLSAPAAQAVESLKATLSTNRIFVDGKETHMTSVHHQRQQLCQAAGCGQGSGI